MLSLTNYDNVEFTCLRSCDMNAIDDACKLTMKRCRVTNRVHIAWTQTGRPSILKCVPSLVKFFFLLSFRLQTFIVISLMVLYPELNANYRGNILFYFLKN